MPRVSFRVDASIDIGTGHLMRCLTLADALRERGTACRFVCRAHSGNLLELIRERGFEAHALPPAGGEAIGGGVRGDAEPAHAAWLGADCAADAQQTLVALGDTRADWLIVDHYALDARWERILRPACRRLMVIDDLADRGHDCDLLLDQNLGRTAADYADRVPAGCTVLAGAQYALLRPEFAVLRPYSLQRRETPKLERLLVTLGGVDKDNATGQVLQALKSTELPADCRITVVMGATAPWLAEVRQLAAQLPWVTEVRVNVSDMARLMADSDLAIGAAGATSWERCCLGLPTMMVVLADNQLVIAQGLEQTGATRVLQSPHQIAEQLPWLLNEFRSSLRQQVAMSRAASGVTDGGGVAKVIYRLER